MTSVGCCKLKNYSDNIKIQIIKVKIIQESTILIHKFKIIKLMQILLIHHDYNFQVKQSCQQYSVKFFQDTEIYISYD